jgi:pantetheine-phosphate adenylyltransferase
MTRAIYPGSFDPITYGHLDIIQRASRLYDEVIVVIMPNDEKKALFSLTERTAMIEQTISGLKNVSVQVGEGLTVDYARKLKAGVLLRGIRAVSDYEYELQLATANMMRAPDIETVFLLSKPEYSFLSSSAVKTIAKNHGDVSNMVPKPVVLQLNVKYR